MASRGNEVKHGVDTVVPEARVTLNTRLLGQNVIVLSLEVADNLCEADPWMSVYMRDSIGERLVEPGFVVDLVTEPRGINNGQ